MVNKGSLFITMFVVSVSIHGSDIASALAYKESAPSTVTTSRNRKERVQQYLGEFASSRFRLSYPQIYTALTHALEKLPGEVFLKLTSRDRPIIFVVSISSGIGRYANSTEFIIREDDPPVFQDGFYLTTLSDELNDSPDPGAIEGIIFHEMAHRYLDHLREPAFSCNMEREANRLVKEWGFGEEYQKASKVFGSKKKGDSPCQDMGHIPGSATPIGTP